MQARSPVIDSIVMTDGSAVPDVSNQGEIRQDKVEEANGDDRHETSSTMPHVEIGVEAEEKDESMLDEPHARKKYWNAPR